MAAPLKVVLDREAAGVEGEHGRVPRSGGVLSQVGDSVREEAPALASEDVEDRAAYRTAAPAADYVRDTIARAVVSGLPIHEIAHMVRHTPRYVKRLLEESDMQERIARYEGMVVQCVVNHKFRMMESLDRAYRVIENALDSADEKLAVSSAWKLVEQVVPKAPERVRLVNETPGVMLDDASAGELKGAMEKISSQVNEIASQLSNGEIDFRKSLKQGHLPTGSDVVGHDA